MKRRSLKRMVFIGALCTVCLVVGITHKNREKKEDVPRKKKEESLLKTNVPTLFFHGYKGTALSFNGMLHRLSRNEQGQRSITLTVSPTGEIKEEGKWRSDDNPLIQVIFEDNTNQEWQQAEWIQLVLAYLAETYQTQTVNIVGHSMGGVSVMRYLASFGSEGSDVEIEKVVTIGSPFNDFNEDQREIAEIIEQGPVVPAPRFEEYQANFGNIPQTIQFLNIAGDVEGDLVSDGTVPVASVVSLNYLFERYQLTYQFVKVEGKNAQHSALHENRKVDQLVADFLWEN